MTASAGRGLALLLALGALVLGAATEARPSTFLSFDFRGEAIERKFTLTPADGIFLVYPNHQQGVSVFFYGPEGRFWDLDFAAPGPAPLVPGMYEGATRSPFQLPTRPGLAVAGEGLGCNQVTGRFVVLEAVYALDGTVLRFAADYEQHCEGAVPALFGSVRYDSAVALGPRLSASRSLAYEGDIATTALAMVVSLSAPAESLVAVRYRSQDGTAAAGTDYAAVSGTVVILPGQTAVVVPVSVLADAESEGDEVFFLILESPQGAPLAFATGVATIVDDDPDKTVLILDSQPGDYVGLGRRVSFTPIDGTARAELWADNTVLLTFQGDTGWYLRFAAPANAALVPGVYEDAQRIATATRPGLDVSGNGRACNTETGGVTGRFVVREAVYAFRTLERLAVDFEQHCGTAPALFGWVRYNSSEALPLRVFAEGGSATEGGTGVVFKVRLSGPGASPVTVDYATVDLTAVASADYEPSLGTLVIPAGALEGLVTVPLIDDPVYEGNETFGLQLTGAAGALIGGETATATILEDDTAPVVSLGDVGVREGDPGRPSIARVLVTLDQSSAQAVTLTYGTVSGTAVAGLDFVVPPWSLTLDPGQTTAAIDVVLREDLAAEGDEAFTVLLYAASGAQIGVGQGTVTVEEDDGPTDFYTLTPCRLLDSRLPAGTIPANRSLTFGAGGRCGIPSEAKAVALNVTAVEPSTPGHFRLGPAGTPPPPTGVLNFAAGQTRAAGPVIATLGQNDALTLYSVMTAGGSTHAIVDVSGYFK